jgi:plastocyanin
MKESLKQCLNIFLKLRRRLASIKWILLLVTTAMFFLSAASNACTFSFGAGNPTVVGPPTGPSPSQTSAVSQPPPQMPSPVSQGGGAPAGGGAPTTPSGSGASGGSTPTGNTEKVMMVLDPKNPSGFGFKDATSGTNVTTIQKGTTVIWVNTTDIPHTVTSDDGKFQSSNPATPLAQGQMYSFTFSIAGTFKYHCSIHPPQVGTVIVTAGGGSVGATPTAQGTP